MIRLAREVTAGRDNDFDRAMALQDFFTGPDSPFRYSLQTAPAGGDDALVEFLTVGRTGYCEQFASAMAVMLRAVGIPSRVAVGFTGGTDFGDYRSIRTSDAHAWVEAYFPGTGWVLFDPTPLTDGRTITPEYVLEARGQLGPDGRRHPGDTRAGTGWSRTSRCRRRCRSSRRRRRPGRRRRGRRLAGLGSAWPLLVAGWRWPRRRWPRPRSGPGSGGAGWPRWPPAGRPRPTRAGRRCWPSPRTAGCPAPPSDTVRGGGPAAGARAPARTRTPSRPCGRWSAAVESSWYGGRHPEPAELAGAGAHGAGRDRDRQPAAAAPAAAARARCGSAAAAPPGRREPGQHDRRPPELIRVGGGRAGSAWPTPARSGGGSAPPSGR